MSDPRLEMVDDAVRAAAENLAAGALQAGGEAASAALDAVASDCLRALAMDMVQNANSGHPGGPCSSMDFAFVLHQRHLRYSRDPEWRDRDRFVLSGGHMSTLLYGLLFLQGRLTMDDLKNFRQLGSPTQGHPVVGFAPGIETTTGPLGQGFANGVGLALGEQLARQAFGDDLVNHRTWVLATDGDLQEGICREAAQLAGHWGLGHLNVFFDSNDIQLASPTGKCWTEDVGASFKATGWHVLEIDGHDHAALDSAIAECKATTDRPSLIVGRTQIAKGTEKEGRVETHGAPLGDATIAAYKQAKGHPGDAFWMPEAVARTFGAALDAGDAAQAEWAARRDAMGGTGGERAERWASFYCPERGEAMLARAKQAVHALDFGDKAIATRSAAGKAQAALAPAVSSLVGGSADLANSTKTDGFEKAVGYVGDDAVEGEPTPRALHFGVREHAMASISNGLALHGGWLPFAGTFLVFSDYLRGAIRLGGISRLPVTYVFTHDSLFLGEDGETHQPVEHTESLRLIPGVQVLRPADAYEAAEAWLFALARHLGDDPRPVCLVLSRQNLPVLPGGFERAAGVHQGGYVVEGGDELPDLQLVASGSEVELALATAAKLAEKGVKARVVSMPCREVFEAQDQAVRDAVIHPGCPFVAVVEAGVVRGWDRVAGGAVEAVGVEHYGESAPAAQLADKVGFTPEKLAARLEGWLEGRAAALKARIERDQAYLAAKLG